MDSRGPCSDSGGGRRTPNCSDLHTYQHADGYANTQQYANTQLHSDGAVPGKCIRHCDH